jgi:hypothetical protein
MREDPVLKDLREIATYLSTYGTDGNIVLNAFNKCEPLGISVEDRNPGEYLTYAKRFMEQFVVSDRTTHDLADITTFVFNSFSAEALLGIGKATDANGHSHRSCGQSEVTVDSIRAVAQAIDKNLRRKHIRLVSSEART